MSWMQHREGNEDSTYLQAVEYECKRCGDTLFFFEVCGCGDGEAE